MPLEGQDIPPLGPFAVFVTPPCRGPSLSSLVQSSSAPDFHPSCQQLRGSASLYPRRSLQPEATGVEQAARPWALSPEPGACHRHPSTHGLCARIYLALPSQEGRVSPFRYCLPLEEVGLDSQAGDGMKGVGGLDHGCLRTGEGT